MPTDPDLLFDGPQGASTTIILAHGAGAAMDTPFMNFFATGLADRGHRVVRFEFPYMANKRSTGKGKPPDREPVLRATWLKVIEMLRASEQKKLVVGGKSMGGRIASLIADEANGTRPRQVRGKVRDDVPSWACQDRMSWLCHRSPIAFRAMISDGVFDPDGNRICSSIG